MKFIFGVVFGSLSTTFLILGVIFGFISGILLAWELFADDSDDSDDSSTTKEETPT